MKIVIKASNPFSISVLLGFLGLFIFFIFKKLETKKEEEEEKPTQQNQEEKKPTKAKSMEQSSPLSSADQSGIKKPRMLILYGSQSGTANQFAHDFENEAKINGFDPQCLSCDEYEDPQTNLPEEELVVLIVATYGEGEPTDDSKFFYKFIRDKKQECEKGGEVFLQKTKFSVFGLGASEYIHYQAQSKFYDEAMEVIGGKRVLERGEGDSDYKIEENYEDWKSSVFPLLAEEFSTKKVQMEIASKHKIVYCDDVDPKTVTPHKTAYGFPSSKKPFFAKIKSKKQLLKMPNSEGRSTVAIEFDLKDGNILYEGGDHIGIFPQNDPILVEKLLEKLGILDKKDKVIEFVPKKEGELGSATLFPTKHTTFAQIFTHHLDITSQLKKLFLKKLADFVKDPEEKQRLDQMIANTEEGKKLYSQYCEDPAHPKNFYTFLCDFPSLAKSIPIELLLEMLPRMQPRFYSVASSPMVDKNRLKIVVGLVVIGAKNNPHADPKTLSMGCCSSFLVNRANVGDGAYIFIRKSNMNHPRNLNVPIMMICAGTGLAPFLGFLEQRKMMIEKAAKLSQQTGSKDKMKDMQAAFNPANPKNKCYLFFGCRRKDEDFIEREFLEDLEKTGVVTKVVTAFSRDSEKKVYVQHRVLDYMDEIWEVLKNDGIIYVCGDAQNMDPEVYGALTEIVKKKASLLQWRAQQYLKKMGDERRYMREVWSP